MTVPKLTQEEAKNILEGAEKKAKEIGVDMVDIAVGDEGGNLIAFYRMNKTKITSIDVAINKAFTAAGARKATHKYAEVAGPGKPAFGIHVSNDGRFTILGGGLPIFVNGHIVGEVGCSSGSVEEDKIVAWQEFSDQFSWRSEDLGIEHRKTKVCSPEETYSYIMLEPELASLICSN